MSSAEQEKPTEDVSEKTNPELTESEQEETLHSEDPSEDRIAALELELQETKDKMMRALAESENTRRRAVKERDDASKYATANFARDLLDFVDNFQRALNSIPEDLKESDTRLSNVISGLEAMEREILGTFEKHHIQKIEPLDQVFDPNFHEVMFETPMQGKENGTIIQVIEPGFVLHDRLLRPARVGVAKATEGEQKSPSDPGTKIDTSA